MQRTSRIASIDILRGLVMIIMALDHTRDYFHQYAFISDPLDVETTTVPIYFTRWITHFCAPIFVLLSGLSACISSFKKSQAEASLFLIKRGIWLVLVEITVVTFGITFNPFYNFVMLQVIWAIGWSMIILGILTRISPRLILMTGILLFFGHNILDHVNLPSSGTGAVIMNLLFRARGTILQVDSSHIIGDFYAILPWTGVMLMGHSIGRWFHKDFPIQKRHRLLLVSGISLIILFIVLRATNLYGNPEPWISRNGFTDNLLTFLNTSKYPPSLLYLSMTLGPACILLVIFEKVRGKWTSIVSVYGRVPFFYYILHFYILHFILVVIFYTMGYTNAQMSETILLFRPTQFGFGLPIVYMIWLGVVVSLYFPCKWYNNYKQRHGQSKWWLSYV